MCSKKINVGENMSVDITAKIGENVFSADKIRQFLCDFFDRPINTEKIDTNKYKFTCFYENDDIILFFIDDRKFSCWDSSILSREYPYRQSLIFDISKFSDLKKHCGVVLKCIIELQKAGNCEVLVTSSIYDEVCYIDIDSKVIWSDNFGYAKDSLTFDDDN